MNPKHTHFHTSTNMFYHSKNITQKQGPLEAMIPLCFRAECVSVCGFLCTLHDSIHVRVRPYGSSLFIKRLDTLKEVEMYREWRSTCFDWLRGQPRAWSMATAWGIAALWFFCFGWWKDYLQSPTIAQRLDTHTHTHTCLQTFFTCTCARKKTRKPHYMQHTDATTDVPFIQIGNCLADLA